MEIVIYSYLTLNQGIMTPSGETLSYGLACFSVIVIFLHFPYAFYKLMKADKVTLTERNDLTQAHGALIIDLKVDTLPQRLFYVQYMVRRLLYLSITFNYPNMSASLQLICIILLNHASFIYIGLVEPHKSKMDRFIVIFNEFIIGLCFLSLLPLSDWNDNPKLQFNYSWLTAGLIQFIITNNILLVIGSSLYSLKLVAVKYYRLGKRFFE